MEITIPYGAEEVTLRLPPDIDADLLGPGDTTAISDIKGSLLAALSKPVGLPPLADALSPESSVVILISDITRAKGSEKLLPLVIGYLIDAGVARGAITVLVARGTHRKLTKEEKEFLRTTVPTGVRVREHDCDDSSNLSALLLTQRGTPVRTNVALKDVDVTILLSPVSFHYFAGFGGGRKLVLPGSTDRASIIANHRLSLVDGDPVRLHDKCRVGNLESNPIHEDMCETLEALDGVFGINFFGNTSGQPVFINAGDPIRAHSEACEAYRNVYERPVDDPYDVAVLSAGGFPHDINLLQSHKAMRNAAGAIRDGGTILYYAKCEEGIGSATLEAALKMKKKEFLKVAWREYALNNTTAISLHDLTDRFEIGMVSAMNVDVLLSCRIKSCVNTEAFLAEALEKHGTNRLAVVNHGAATLPKVLEDGAK
jgi:nickel-dependent lactate racemase